MPNSQLNSKLDIEQLADFLAGRAAPEVAGKMRRELSDPSADASELLVAFDSGEGDPLCVDWSRLDEPGRQSNSIAEGPIAEGPSGEIRPDPVGRRRLYRWTKTIGAGLAAGLASVAILAAADGPVGHVMRLMNAAGTAQSVDRPSRAIKFEAQIAKAKLLAPEIVAQSAPNDADRQANIEPSGVENLASIELAAESRPTGLQMREHLATLGIGSP